MYLPVDQGAMLAHTFLLHDLSPDWKYKINGVLWSIALEAQLYLIFPILVQSVRKFGRLPTLAVTSALAVTLMVALPDSVKLNVWFLPLFVLGMAAAYMAFKPHPRFGTYPREANVLALLAMGALILLLANNGWISSTDCLVGLATASLCYSQTVEPQQRMGRWLNSRPLVCLGTFSYSLYLMHHPIAQTLYWLRPTTWTVSTIVAFQFFVSLPVIVGLTWGFSLLFERPFMSGKSRLNRAVLSESEVPEWITEDLTLVRGPHTLI